VRKSTQLEKTSEGFPLSVFNKPGSRVAYLKKEECVAMLNSHALVHFGQLIQRQYIILGRTRFSFIWQFRDRVFEHVGEPDLVTRNMVLNDFVTLCSEVRFSEDDLHQRPWMGQICGEALSVVLADSLENGTGEWLRPVSFVVQAGLRVGLVFLQFRREAISNLLRGDRPSGDNVVYRIFNVVTGGAQWDRPDTVQIVATLYQLAGKFGEYPHATALLVANSWESTLKPLPFDGRLEMK